MDAPQVACVRPLRVCVADLFCVIKRGRVCELSKCRQGDALLTKPLHRVGDRFSVDNPVGQTELVLKGVGCRSGVLVGNGHFYILSKLTAKGDPIEVFLFRRGLINRLLTWGGLTATLASSRPAGRSQGATGGQPRHQTLPPGKFFIIRPPHLFGLATRIVPRCESSFICCCCVCGCCGCGVWCRSNHFRFNQQHQRISVRGIVPTRLLDTREGQTTFDGFDQAVGRLDADTTYELDIAGRAGIPQDALLGDCEPCRSQPIRRGYLTVYPCGVDQPLASALNYMPGDNNANEFTVPIGTTATSVSTPTPKPTSLSTSTATT